MRVEGLEKEKILDFVAYCKKHRNEIDDSYLYDSDLLEFVLGDENPTYLAINQQDEIIGVASLVMDDYHKRGKRARFRIFHCEIQDIQCYQLMLEAV